jgi:hypothetical protein
MTDGRLSGKKATPEDGFENNVINEGVVSLQTILKPVDLAKWTHQGHNNGQSSRCLL